MEDYRKIHTFLKTNIKCFLWLNAASENINKIYNLVYFENIHVVG